jgi:hypothetical protein
MNCPLLSLRLRGTKEMLENGKMAQGELLDDQGQGVRDISCNSQRQWYWKIKLCGFFFLELHRRAARHFIKVEKDSTRVQKDPNPRTEANTHHTPGEKRLNSRHQLQEKHDQWPQGLRTKGHQPGQELLELRSPCRTPEAAFHAHFPRHSLETWPQLLEHTIISVFPDLPHHQDC